jgi:hypothetical protein
MHLDLQHLSRQRIVRTPLPPTLPKETALRMNIRISMGKLPSRRFPHSIAKMHLDLQYLSRQMIVRTPLPPRLPKQRALRPNRNTLRTRALIIMKESAFKLGSESSIGSPSKDLSRQRIVGTPLPPMMPKETALTPNINTVPTRTWHIMAQSGWAGVERDIVLDV